MTNFLEPTRISGIGPRYKGHPGPYAITEADLAKIFPEIGDVRPVPYGVDNHVKGDADPSNLELLTRLVAHLQPKTILEIGTFRGKTTYNLALYAPPDSTVFTIDLPLDMIGEADIPGYGTDRPYFQHSSKIGKEFKGSNIEKKIQQIFADSCKKEAQTLLDEMLRDGKIDFAFIDASHDYESTKINFEELVLPRLNDGGVVVFDNYGDLATHVGISHYLQRKAHDEGYVFYWYAPLDKRTTCVIFFKSAETINRDWKENKGMKK